jgi:hypothetical protein
LYKVTQSDFARSCLAHVTSGILWLTYRRYVVTLLLQYDQHHDISDGDSWDRLRMEVHPYVKWRLKEWNGWAFKCRCFYDISGTSAATVRQWQSVGWWWIQ